MTIRLPRLQTAAFVFVVAAPLYAPRAEACLFFDRTIRDLRFSVADGATVPRNVVLFAGGIDSDDGSAWWLVNNDEAIHLEMILTSDRSSRFEPATPLSLFGSRAGDDGNDFFLSETEADGGSRTYRIVALDHAGNESEPTLVDMNLGCPGNCSSADLTACRRWRPSCCWRVGVGVAEPVIQDGNVTIRHILGPLV